MLNSGSVSTLSHRYVRIILIKFLLVIHTVFAQQCPRGLYPAYIPDTGTIEACSVLEQTCEFGSQCYSVNAGVFGSIAAGTAEQGICCGTQLSSPFDNYNNVWDNSLIGTQTNFVNQQITTGNYLCPQGTLPYYGPGNIPQICNVNNVQFNTCPGTYACTLVQVGTAWHSICCSRPNTVFGNSIFNNPQNIWGNRGLGLTCPSGQSPALFGNQPQTCSVQANNCPNGYGCHQVDSLTGICCAVFGNYNYNAALDIRQLANLCPNGRMPYFFSGNTPQVCSLQFNNCPGGYVCTQLATQQSICCQIGWNTGWNNNNNNYIFNTQARYGDGLLTANIVCPSGTTAAMFNGQPQTCNIQANNCPSGTGCTQATPLVAICCGNTVVTNYLGYGSTLGYQPQAATCPLGYAILFENGQAKRCNPSVGLHCPLRYSCLSTSGTQIYFYNAGIGICCGTPGFRSRNRFSSAQ